MQAVTKPLLMSCHFIKTLWPKQVTWSSPASEWEETTQGYIKRCDSLGA